LVVLLVLALAAFARADGSEMAVTAADAAVERAGEEAVMQVAEAAADVAVDEDVDEAEEEGEDEVEAEEGDEAEEEEEEGTEDEAAFLEAGAEAQSESETELDAEGKPLRKPKIVGAVLPPAPRRRWKYHPERVVEAQTTNPFEDPEMGKLNLALAAVKEDILSTNKQINDERKWVIAVAKIIASYNDKMKRVEAHIIALRKEMKQLYKKKKQIENLKLQKALEAKLKEARNELATLTSSLKHVATKQGELNRSGSELRTTIAGIMAQLAKLRGQNIRPRARRGRGRVARKKCGKGFRFSRKAKKCVRRRRVAAKRSVKRTAKKL